MLNKKIWLVLLLVLSIGAVAVAEEFVADMVTTVNGKTMHSKMFFAKDKMRVESANVISIMRMDKNVMYSLMADKTYMEMAIPAQNKMTSSKTVKGEISREKKGNDKINGYDCEKYLVTYRDPATGKTSSVYQWLSSQAIIPVKTMAVDGSWASEVKSITKGKIAASKFEVPAGYRKFSMPSMGSGGGMPAKGIPGMRDMQKMFQ